MSDSKGRYLGPRPRIGVHDAAMVRYVEDRPPPTLETHGPATRLDLAVALSRFITELEGVPRLSRSLA